MIDIYRLEQVPDDRWAVVVAATGVPVRLAGIPQTGLTQVEAEITLDMLTPASKREHEVEASHIRPRAA